MARKRSHSRYSSFSSFWPTWGRPTAPRPADGIRARSQKGPVGDTWWSRRFIEVLHSFQIGARLGRGLRYARTGQVLDLVLQPGKVTAKVQGTRARPYDVEIRLKELSQTDWKKVEEALAGQALYVARLLAGEMPTDIEDAFARCRLSLFPAGPKDLETSCSCPDWSNPCKHVAATYYILAERFDEDPFLVLAWRGRERDVLLANLRRLRASTGDEPALRATGPTGTPSPAIAEPLPADPNAFWTGAPVDVPVHVKAAAVPDALVRQAGPLGIPLAGRDLAALLADLYPALVAAALRRAEDQADQA